MICLFNTGGEIWRQRAQQQAAAQRRHLEFVRSRTAAATSKTTTTTSVAVPDLTQPPTVISDGISTTMSKQDQSWARLMMEPAARIKEKIMSTPISCGVFLWGLRGTRDTTPEEQLVETMKYAEKSFNHHCAFYIFSDHVRGRTYEEKEGKITMTPNNHKYLNGEMFADYIRTQGLGDITETPMAQNPNSGNVIKIWCWAVNHAALTEWCAARGIRNVNIAGGNTTDGVIHAE